MNDIAKIFDIEEIMLKMPQLNLETKHYFSGSIPGKKICAREIKIPQGTLLTGAIHKYENMNILSKGDISVTTEDGVKRIQAPCTIVSPAGTKRIAYAHEDCVWTTFFATDETDPVKIVQEFTTNSQEEYLEFQKILNIEGN